MSKLVITKVHKGKFLTLRKDYIVYKAVRCGIAQLLLPKGTRISVPRDYNLNNYFRNRKLRADQAVVMAIVPYDRELVLGRIYKAIEKPNHVFYSRWSRAFQYKMGELVKPNNGFNTLSTRPCASGIHFFCKLEDAEGWF